MTTLPEGYSIRPATIDDVDAIVDVMHSTAVIEPSALENDRDYVLTGWRSSNFDPAQDTWVVVAPDGLLVGYEEASRIGAGGQANIDGYVRPTHSGLGIGTAMLRAAEARIRQVMQVSELSVRAGMSANDPQAHAMFLHEGYKQVRSFQRMQVDLLEPPAPAEFPDGIRVRTFVQGQDDRATHAAVIEAFGDHWGSVPTSFEDWAKRQFGSEHFDPSLWFLALDGDEVAGTVLCRKQGEGGWVNNLAVRRPWRKRGLGLALLQHAFAEMYKRGMYSIALGVDSDSLTGATRLYERAGMRVTEHFMFYDKTLVK